MQEGDWTSAALKNTALLDLILGMWGWLRLGLQSLKDAQAGAEDIRPSKTIPMFPLPPKKAFL